MKKKILVASCLAASLMVGCSSIGVGGSHADISKQILPPNDGWAAAEGPVTGGASAVDAHIYTVSSRKAFVDALKEAGDAPKIIKISGTVNLSSDDQGRELTEKDYAVAPYNFEDYKNAYAPSVWNIKPLIKKRPNRKLTGPLEEARKASQQNQKNQIVIKVPSNTSIIGLGDDAKIVKGMLLIGKGIENVIIRNISFEDAFDYFPDWDPGDSFKLDASYPGCQAEYVNANTGPQKCRGGRWNSEYDLISISGGKRIWIDRSTFSDGDRPDSLFPPVYPFPQNEITQKVQHHDGLIDITNQADLVTISNSYFHDHDKAFLIGNSDKKTADTGYLRVTLHSNYFKNVGQRMPRVRYGKIHSYNNYFVGNAEGDSIGDTAYERHVNSLKNKPKHNILRQALGAGKNSAIYSEANVFEIENGTPANAIGHMKGKVAFDKGSMFNGKMIDIIAEANKVNSKKTLSKDVGWTPTLYGPMPVLPASEVIEYVKKNAGAGKL
ncbi:pectate lyase family protein [Marinomonas transparens]|uniref:PbsX family transcriptional regulator n=1 Tax=Marinomonas transparens TaxID=2795388 RepID=A0A934N022_9GAMM|nr:PbsX family transcriptional regulator [Marinomonas transparens]MBJ7536272.1 PbsX family transcriptional regulator [Marinomonas transparens]